MTWPTAGLDTIAQLRVLAAALPGVGMVERVVDLPYDHVWGFMADLERSVPAFDPLVSRLRIRSADGDHLEIATRGPFGVPGPRFDVELRDGWCWMQSRLYLVGMAAVADGDRTRVAQVEGMPVRLRAGRVLGPVFRGVVATDVRNLVRILHEP
jgi:hypothetical protein